MLDQDIKQQLTAYLERVQQPFEMVATLGTDAKSDELRELLEEVASIRADVSNFERRLSLCEAHK